MDSTRCGYVWRQGTEADAAGTGVTSYPAESFCITSQAGGPGPGLGHGSGTGPSFPKAPCTLIVYT